MMMDLNPPGSCGVTSGELQWHHGSLEARTTEELRVYSKLWQMKIFVLDDLLVITYNFVTNIMVIKSCDDEMSLSCIWNRVLVWNSANGHLVQLNLFIIVVFNISSCLVPLLFHWSDDELEILRAFNISRTCGIRKHNNWTQLLMLNVWQYHMPASSET